MTDSRLREACSTNAIREATEGKFSPKRSRDQLRRVYQDALAA
jgi:hypothetical protein